MEFKYAYYFLCNGEKLVIQRRNRPDTRIYENNCASAIALGPDDISADDWIVRERDRDVPDDAELSCYEFDETSLAFLKKLVERDNDDHMITDPIRFQYGLWADWNTFGEYHVQHMAFINTISVISGGKEKVVFFTPDYHIPRLLSQLTFGKSDLAVGDVILADPSMFDEIKSAIETATKTPEETVPLEWGDVKYLLISTACPDAVVTRILKFHIKIIAEKWADFDLADRVTRLANSN